MALVSAAPGQYQAAAEYLRCARRRRMADVVLEAHRVYPDWKPGARRLSLPMFMKTEARPGHSPLFLSLLLASLVHVLWKLYTQHTYEDAFITFRFARNLSNGLGFVFNANEPIYGTTSPLFVIVIAAWIRIFPNLVVLGATLFGLVAGLGSIVLVWKLLDEQAIANPQKLLVTGWLVLSDKLWLHDMGGLETPLVICAMMASYFMLLRGKSVWAGVLAGILLWLRLDSAFWIGCLALGGWYITRRVPLKFIVTTLVVYLPWCVFATLCFGSPIPYTIYAKSVAYYAPIEFSLILFRAETFLRWLTPLSLPNLPADLATWIAIATLLFSVIGTIAYRRQNWLMVLPLFCLAEFVRLVVMGETIETRYFVPVYWGLMILFGLGMWTAGEYLSRWLKLRPLSFILPVAVYTCVSLWFSWRTAQSTKEVQYFVNDSSLKPLGVWLDKNTPTASTVFLEPLGYVGFYSNRHMIDEVGLVSPQVVALKKEGYTTFALIASLNPDYTVLHCDDARLASDVFLARYSRVTEFNPMNYDPNNPSELARQNLARAACYQVWKK